MASVKYIGNRYFIRRWFKWYHIDFDIDRPEVVAFPVGFVPIKPKAPPLKEERTV